VLVAVEDIVDEAVNDGGLPHGLVPQKYDLILQQGRNRSLRQVQVAYVRHYNQIK
jgi:hypothetical protein